MNYKDGKKSTDLVVWFLTVTSIILISGLLFFLYLL
jgi:hypothetical protein